MNANSSERKTEKAEVGFAKVVKGQWLGVQHEGAQALQPFQVRWVQQKEGWLVLDPKPAEAFDGKRLRYYDMAGNPLGTAQGYVTQVYTSEAEVAKAIKGWAKEVARQVAEAKAAEEMAARKAAEAEEAKRKAIAEFLSQCEELDPDAVQQKGWFRLLRTPTGSVVVIVEGVEMAVTSEEALWQAYK